MITVTINTVDRTDQIVWSSFRRTNVLSKEPDMLEFRLHNHAGKTYKPALGDEVIVTKDAVRVFGGVVVDSAQSVDGKLLYTDITCKDYTQSLDRFLVTKRYQAMSANAIIADILSDFTDGTFTGTNVNAPETIDDVNFNYYYVSDALYKLAQTIGYDWYVDYYRDIHFFKSSNISAPFSLDETSGNFVWNSLKLTENIHQLRNKIIVRGGTVTGDERTQNFTADGVQETWFIGRDHVNMTVKKNTVTQTLGAEGKDDNDLGIQVLYNPNSGHVRFRAIPSASSAIEVTSTPQYPIIKQYTDAGSISLYGIFEFVIVDKTIKSSEGASARALAELDKWGDEVHTGTFITYTDGLRAGMSILLNFPSFGINRTYRIERVVSRARSPVADFEHTVSIVASDVNTIVDVFADLLINRPNNELEIQSNEIVDLVNGFTETVSNTENLVVSSLIPCWVAGDFAPTSPTDTRRQTFADADCYAGDDTACPV